MPADDFAKIADIVLGFEGGFQRNPRDPGNWSSGKIGVGTLVGTNYGIAAAFHPGVDIEKLTREQALGMLERGYWTPLNASWLPAPLALLLFDFVVNSGSDAAVEALQSIVRVRADRRLGQMTCDAVKRSVSAAGDGLLKLCVAYQAARLVHLASKAAFSANIDGFSSRLFEGLAIAVEWTVQPGAPA